MTRLALILSAALIGAPAFAAEPGIVRPGFIPDDARILAAVDAAPQIQEAKAAALAARAGARVLALGEHETTISAGVDKRTVGGQRDFTETSVELSRAFRLPGKAALDRAAGAAGLRAAEEAIGDARHETSLELIEIWLEWQEASALAAADAAELATYGREVQALNRRVEERDAAVLDLEQAQAAEAVARAALARSEGRARAAKAEIDARFPGLAPAQPEPLPPPTAPVRPFDAWREAILTHSHELSLARAQAEREELLARRARLDRIADPTVGLGAFHERGGDETGFGLRLSMPLGGPRRAAVADQRQAEAAAAQARYAAAVSRIGVKADTLVIAAATSLSAWLQADKALDAAERSAMRGKRAYDLGERDLSDLLVVQRQAFEAARREAEARAGTHLALLRLSLAAHEMWLADDD